ncbi:predicted protein [Streptomyces viridosporus ATCC 14672]|uniref:Predicted protein n=1 Tax=Streptomyces viridosporus (strain ATCC 14672 / DSM 40746 / JCM 4963 / KCTC 9882 / NRRL B-12104 / FH 1290) TaxID=566461 RepID=D5ZZT5_STRV1|nr:predicted protein [Streptomyces viridosporus ATCC 14672]
MPTADPLPRALPLARPENPPTARRRRPSGRIPPGAHGRG